jgi:hypothetical protein
MRAEARAVATNAATGNPNVKGLVYIDAFMPDQGETLVGLAESGGSCIGGEEREESRWGGPVSLPAWQRPGQTSRRSVTIAPATAATAM